MQRKWYYEALAIAEFISEGHTIKEAKEEFRLAGVTITKRLNGLASQNPMAYQKAAKVLYAKKTYEGKVVEI